MAAYRINLDIGQLDLLIEVMNDAAHQHQRRLQEKITISTAEEAQAHIDAFSRIPRLASYLEEQRALGPVPELLSN